MPITTMSLAQGCAAPIKSTTSFQTLEAALPPGMVQVSRSSSAQASSIPRIGDHWANSGANGRSAWRDREIWMQSEQGWPRIVLTVHPRPPCEECAKGRDSFTRTVQASFPRTFAFPACLPEAFPPADVTRLRRHWGRFFTCLPKMGYHIQPQSGKSTD